jgi:hypothetical protein
VPTVGSPTLPGQNILTGRRVREAAPVPGCP